MHNKDRYIQALIEEYLSKRMVFVGGPRQEGSNFLVTGSARLDYYRRGGDSLFGRYRYIRLHPFSVSELNIKNILDLNHLIKFGGFPEPYFSGSEKNHKLWCRERLHKIVNDDIRDLESVREFNFCC